MNDPEKQFVARTKEILNEVKTRHDVSFLINCSFGLITFPHLVVFEKMGLPEGEKKNWWYRSHFWKRNLKTVPGLPKFISDELKNNKFPKSLGDFFHRLRNALCHQRFQPINNKTLRGIEVVIVKKHNVSLKLEKNNLIALLIFVADTYLAYLQIDHAADNIPAKL